MENVALVTIKVPHYSNTSSRPNSSTNGNNNGNSNSTKMLSLPPVVLPSMPNANLIRCEPPPPLPSDVSLGVKFLSAGMAACMADMVTFPLDTAKVRLQIQGESMAATLAGGASRAVGGARSTGMLSTILTISRTEGPRALYSGLAPGLQRQMCFASVRIGLYDAVKQSYTNLLRVDPNQKNVSVRILAGITTGGAAVLVAQPTDVVKVRMQASGKTARYSSCMAAYRTIALQEGVRGLWKGTVPNVSRNAIVNCTELVSYDLIKEALLSHNLLQDGIRCHFLSAVGAGFFTTLFASPIDVLKTRFMNSRPGQYKGVFDCGRTMYKEGGIRTFYKGAVPAFLRFGPWNVVMFISYEQLKKHLSRNSDDNANNNSSRLQFPQILRCNDLKPGVSSSRFV